MKALISFFGLVVLTLLPRPVLGESWGSVEFPKSKIEIIWYCGELERALTQLARRYDGAEVMVRCVPINDWHAQIFGDFARKGGADLVMLDSQFIGEAVAGGHVIELTGWMKDNVDTSKYVPKSLSVYGEYPQGSGRYYGIPALADTQVLVYRSDLYSHVDVQLDYKAKTGRGLEVPRTWSELLLQARFFKESPWVKGGYVATWRGKRGYDEISTQWNQILWSFGGELWDPGTLRVNGVLNSPQGVVALEFARELFLTGPNEGAYNFGFDEVVDSLCRGEAAIGNIWFALAHRFLDRERCKYSDRLAFGILPGEVRHAISLGGQGISVSAYSKNKEAALFFIKWFESEEVQMEWARLGGTSARSSVLKSDVFIGAAPYNRYFLESFGLAKDFWNLPEYGLMLAVSQEYLEKAIVGEMTPREALNAIARRQQEILDVAYPKGQKAK
ncbi:MAG: extracellular solute-binding protein [Candidatus Caldarchaeum sp.]